MSHDFGLDRPDPAEDSLGDPGGEVEDDRDEVSGAGSSPADDFHIFEDTEAEVNQGSDGNDPAAITTNETDEIGAENRAGRRPGESTGIENVGNSNSNTTYPTYPSSSLVYKARCCCP